MAVVTGRATYEEAVVGAMPGDPLVIVMTGEHAGLKLRRSVAIERGLLEWAGGDQPAEEPAEELISTEEEPAEEPKSRRGRSDKRRKPEGDK